MKFTNNQNLNSYMMCMMMCCCMRSDAGGYLAE